MMDNPTDGMIEIGAQLKKALKEMAKCKDLNEREVHSRIVKNLAESMGVYIGFATSMMESGIMSGMFDNNED